MIKIILVSIFIIISMGCGLSTFEDKLCPLDKRIKSQCYVRTGCGESIVKCNVCPDALIEFK